MTRVRNKMPLVVTSLALIFVMSQVGSAQERRGRRGFSRTTSTVRLAGIEQVQTELKLSDEAKAAITKVNEDLRTEGRELFQGGFSEETREKYAKLTSAASKKVGESLDDGQRKRLQQIYIQVNGATVLSDDNVAKELKITDAQKEKLKAARTASQEAARGSIRRFPRPFPRRTSREIHRAPGEVECESLGSIDRRSEGTV